MSFIALIAAGIGIMNIMLVSVTERTRKLVSGKRWELASQIFYRSLLLKLSLCEIGGLIGVGLAYFGGNLAALAFSFPPVFRLMGIHWNRDHSFVGVVFGVYPAWESCKILDPIESLRYE